MQYLNENTMPRFKDVIEDAPAMSTGPAVAGTGDDPVHWRMPKGRRKKQRRPIDATSLLRRLNKK